MKKKLGLVAVFVVLLSLAPSLPSSPPTEEIEGNLEIIMATETGGEKTCKPIYYVNSGGKRTQFSMPATAPPISPGQKIKISGQWEEVTAKSVFIAKNIATIAIVPDAKKTMSSADNVSDYLPEQKSVLGEQKVLVVCLSFLDTENTPSWGKEKINDKIFSNKHSLNAYWKACSVDETGEPQVWLTGSDDTLDGWRKMPKNVTEYGYGSESELDFSNEFIDDLIELLDPEIDFSKSMYDGLIVFRSGTKWSYDWSTSGKFTVFTDDGKVEISLSFLTEVDIEINNEYAAHETGHGLFSLLHSVSVSILSGKMRDYGDWWEARGGAYGLLDALHKYILGWLDKDQIEIVTSGGNFWLDQRELTSDGTKLLVIPLGFEVGWDDAIDPILIYFEYHRGLGEFDSELSFPNTNASVDPSNIVLLRKYELYKLNGYSSTLVYVASDDGNDCLDLESNEFCDSEYENLDHYGVCVQVLQKTGEDAEAQAEVKVTLTSDYSIPVPCPTEYSPDIFIPEEEDIGNQDVGGTIIYPNGSVTVNAYIKNEMRPGCGTRTYNLESDVPEDTWWSVVFNKTAIEVGGYQTGTITFSINVSSSPDIIQLGSNYEIKIRAVDEENWELTNEVSAYLHLEILPSPTPTPTACESEAISVSPIVLKLKRKKSRNVIVTVTGADNCAVEGETVTAIINAIGKKRVSVSPTSVSTDENGQATFTIAAKNKIGSARVTFRAGDISKSLTVKVK